MKSEPSEDPDTEDNKDESEENNQISYQEMYELAQRKLLRQVSNHASTHDIGNYPRLFVVDIEEKSSDMGKTVEYQVHTLCECDQGWHSVADPIVLSTEKRNPDIVEEDLDMNDLEDFTPYLSRVAMVMEHNSGFVLDLFTSAEGKRCLKRIQELAMICSDSFQTSYHSLRVKVHKLDTSRQKGKLIRCRLPSGKIIWLCEEHSVQMKVAVLSEEGPEGKHMVANQPWLDAMLEVLRTRATRNHPFEFKNNRKAKRKLTDIIAGVDDVVKNQRRSVLRKHSSLNKTAQQQALLELSSQDTTVKEETADSKTDKKKEEHKQKKQKDFQEQEKMCVESPSKCSEAGNKGDTKEAMLELNSQDAAVKEETTDPKTKKKKKEKKKKKSKDFQEQENTSVESPTRYSEGGKNNKEDTEEAKMTTKEDGKQLARSVSPNPTPVASSRTASPNTQPDLEARRSTPSPKPREGKKAEKDLGQGSDQQPVQAKSTACVVL
ncbi:uncharacterized protein LOC110455024 [Mizuhopecten yessoensis]|uniref:uncharacterized protein LOC110455024 n=1 Tax=Mizuhopecten yessoensis TaxID=6573 RepID=UPI000B45BF16|nr:uncharacterized protein LOC110455024 [Mizuhopecten yessoensis]